MFPFVPPPKKKKKIQSFFTFLSPLSSSAFLSSSSCSPRGPLRRSVTPGDLRYPQRGQRYSFGILQFNSNTFNRKRYAYRSDGR